MENLEFGGKFLGTKHSQRNSWSDARRQLEFPPMIAFYVNM